MCIDTHNVQVAIRGVALLRQYGLQLWTSPSLILPDLVSHYPAQYFATWRLWYYVNEENSTTQLLVRRDLGGHPFRDLSRFLVALLDTSFESDVGTRKLGCLVVIINADHTGICDVAVPKKMTLQFGWWDLKALCEW